MCQKQHGAASASDANVGRAGFVIGQGADLVNEYAASEQARRGFCKVCGSTLYWRSEAAPDRIAITLGPPYDGPGEHALHTDTQPSRLPQRWRRAAGGAPPSCRPRPGPERVFFSPAAAAFSPR
jgi:hypothetical protein